MMMGIFQKRWLYLIWKGSEHFSFSKTGCILLVILYGGTNELIDWLSNDWLVDYD